MSRRRQLSLALALSLLAHAVLLWCVWQDRSPGSRVATHLEQTPIVVELAVMKPASSPAPAPPVVSPGHADREPQSKPRAQRSAAASPKQSPPASAEREPAASSAEPSPPSPARAEDAAVEPPRQLALLPRVDVLGPALADPDVVPGRTIRPGDPSLHPDVLRAEEEFRVQARVDEWAQGVVAEGRAQRGLPHPYFRRVGEALRGGLSSAEGGTPAALGAPNPAEFLFKRWTDAAERYARTGNPDVTKPGLSPHQIEKQRELFGTDTHWIDTGEGHVRTVPWLQLMTQSAETLQDLSYSEPLLKLTLELRQDPSGEVIDQRILEGSASARFDRFVLEVVPLALRELGPVPAEALRDNAELRSVWLIQGWPSLPKEVEDALVMFGSPGVYGVASDPMLKQLAAERPFAFRARLLRAY